MPVEQRILKIACKKWNQHGGNQQSVWCSPVSIITVCPSFYPLVLGQVNGVRKFSFCCHCDNISLHTLLSALWLICRILPICTLLSLPDFSVSYSVQEGMWVRRCGAVGERHLEVGLITQAKLEPAWHCLISGSETYLVESAAELNVAGFFSDGCEK